MKIPPVLLNPKHGWGIIKHIRRKIIGAELKCFGIHPRFKGIEKAPAAEGRAGAGKGEEQGCLHTGNSENRSAGVSANAQRAGR